MDNINFNLTLWKKTVNEILKQIDFLCEQREHIVIAIEGNAGAGKSTLAKELQTIYDCNVIHMDDFFLPLWLRSPQRYEEIGGNIDYVRFQQEVVENLEKNISFSYQKYSCAEGKLIDKITIFPKKITIIEGVYSLHPYFTDIYSIKIFMSIDSIEQKRRIITRNGTEMFSMFETKWIPMENRYFEKFSIKEKCHFRI